jgi:hypothetical protein
MTVRSFIIAFTLGVLITPLAAEAQPSANLPRLVSGHIC